MDQKRSETQIALPLNFREEKRLSNYYAGENEAILSILYKAAIGRGEHFIYLWGKEKVGLTHLLQACCNAATEKGLTAFYLSLHDLDQLKTSVFDNLENMQLVCIDNIENIAKSLNWEEAFFDFFNRMQDAKKRLIIATKKTPENLGLSLADITSRLKSGIVFYVQDLSDEEKIQALRVRAKNRGMDLPVEVAQFVLNHFPRDLGTLFQILDRLDQVSLEQQRKLTIPFVKKTLQEFP